MRRFLIWTCLLPPLYSLVLGVWHLKESWDDGAIMAAFSHTFATYHIIALTPLSPSVEGFSSLTWFLLLMLVKPISNSPEAYLIWMKVISALCFLGSLGIFYIICLKYLTSRLPSLFAVWLLAFTITPFHEAFNGMEMNLALLLFLGLVLATTEELFWPAAALSTLLIATRFESPYLICALFAGGLLAAVDKRFILKQTAIAVLVFALLCLWRHHQFGVWMPNTVYAKLWWPYQPATFRDKLDSRLAATGELGVLIAPLMVVTFFAAMRRVRINQPIITTLALASVGFGLLFGKNLGHRGRMVECLLPFVILWLMIYLEKAAQRMKVAIVSIGVIHLCLWGFIVHRLTVNGDSVPISKYEREGLAAEDVRKSLHRDSLIVLIPDVGGAALCCSNLRILDIALLTNPELAKDGYNGFVHFFMTNNPDVVEAHEVWAAASGIYGSGLLDNYSLVESRETRLFVRNDLYDKLAGMTASVEKLPHCLDSAKEDQDYSRGKGTCLVLSR